MKKTDNEIEDIDVEYDEDQEFIVDDEGPWYDWLEAIIHKSVVDSKKEDQNAEIVKAYEKEKGIKIGNVPPNLDYYRERAFAPSPTYVLRNGELVEKDVLRNGKKQKKPRE